MPVSTRALRDVAATRYVTPLREGGSLPGLVEADDDGLYVTKFRGAGQGVRALVAEVIVGELARGADLLVPELVTVALDARLGAAEPDPEIQELITASEGVNLGVDFLPGALAYTPAGAWQPSPELAADIVWLDALATNVDRTAAQSQPAALARAPVGHRPRRRALSPARGPRSRCPPAAAVPAHRRPRPAGARRRRSTRPTSGCGHGWGTGRSRPRSTSCPWSGSPHADAAEVYAEYLHGRLAAGGFVEEAERARTGR